LWIQHLIQHLLGVGPVTMRVLAGLVWLWVFGG
jgi:hypothetical protein